MYPRYISSAVWSHLSLAVRFPNVTNATSYEVSFLLDFVSNGNASAFIQNYDINPDMPPSGPYDLDKTLYLRDLYGDGLTPNSPANVGMVRATPFSVIHS